MIAKRQNEMLKANLFPLFIFYPLSSFLVLLWEGRFNDQLLNWRFPDHCVKKSVEKCNDGSI